MGEKETKNPNQFSYKVSTMEKRKLKTLHEKKRSVWMGFGLFGIVGWSIVVPTLLGAALGLWLDKKYTQSFSWTLTFLLIGLIIGCIIAWNWVSKENEEMHQGKNKKDE